MTEPINQNEICQIYFISKGATVFMCHKRLKGSSFKPSLISFTSAVVILYSRVGWRCDGVSNKSFHLCKQKSLPLKSLFYFNFNTDKFLIDLSNLSEDFHEPT